MNKRTLWARLVTLSLSIWACGATARTLSTVDALAAASVAPTPKSAAVNALPPSVSLEPKLSVPTFLWATQAGATMKALGAAPAQRAAQDPEHAARAYLADVADLYRISPAEIAALPMHDLQRFPDGGSIARFRGQVAGIEVFREQVNVLVDKRGALVAVGGFAMGAPAATQKGAEVFTMPPEQAVAAALADFRFSGDIAQRLTRAPAEGGYTAHVLPAGMLSEDGATLVTARSKPVWFRLPGDLVAAHYVEVQVRDGAWPNDVDAYAYVISARDGAMLFRHSQTVEAFTYRAYAESASPFLPLPGPAGHAGFPHPSGTPDGFQPAPRSGNLVTVDSAPFSKNDPWLAAIANRTQGNNVEAFTDMLAPDDFGTPGTDECNVSLPVDGDLHACLTSPGMFDHVYDFTQALNANRSQTSAVVTNLFYMNNFLHDWYYDAGFNEAAGNAQTGNYGRGGIGNDSIFAEAQDFAGTNNANMTIPADGSRPRMRMYRWTSSIALAKVNAPATIAGVRQSGTADFGPSSFDLTGDVVLAADAANPEGPTTTDGCTAFTNAAAVAGKIALIDRGVCTFVVKVKNAQTAGAIGVVIANNVMPGAPGMAGTDASITIPAVSIPLADGDALKAQLAAATVSMRIARQSALDRDGSLDNTTVAHEWGHYLSNRLIANANGLVANQAMGMGEGWSDFNALLLLVKESDLAIPSNAGFNGTYPISAYSLSGPDYAPDVLNNAYYYGIRRYPYSRDMNKAPLTFRHITDGVAPPTSPAPSPRISSANSEVHNTGEVWANMLWECYSNLLNDSGRLTFAQAQDRMKRYLVAGFKMTPTDPTFIDGRDALLAAMQAQDAQDHDLCLKGFAKRGAGVGAVAPGKLSDDNSGVVESYLTSAAAPPVTPVIEYYHAVFDHYFITNVADEITKLDNGTFVGWMRTGESFNVYASAGVNTSDVCRFFSTSFAPKSSHFYTPSASECVTVKQNPDWQFEAVVFAVPTPDAAGNCAAGTQPVYRLYNNGQGAAPNHRYITSLATRGQMLAKGWLAEGYGDLGVIMCSPA